MQVYLIGCGPGDPELLTLKAARLIPACDAIVYDDLIPDAALALARPDAERHYVGKRAGRDYLKQPEINALLLELARRGLKVARLKGGDPCLFGRGGEEALALVAARVPFRIVPGITAGIGGLAYAGIPVTHREVNHAVTFLTGHDSSGLVPDRINWEGIAKGSPVIVMYMAMKHIGQIAANLIAGGRAPDEPVAFVCNAATGEQAVLETTLARAQADAEAAGIEPPAIVVVGEVVRLRASLDWLGALTQGRRLSADPFGSRELKDPA